MPARTLNDFAAGFFYGEISADWEAKMVIGYMCKCQGKGENNQGGRCK